MAKNRAIGPQPIDEKPQLLPAEKLHFRDQLRNARASAMKDSEAFSDMIVAIEQLGSRLTPGHKRGLGAYIGNLRKLAEQSPLAEEISNNHRCLATPFGTLCDLVRVARNDAVHNGAFARRLTDHAVDLGIVLEDALSIDLKEVSDFMVRHPIVAEPWHPLSFIRQTMLKYSFSFLPVRLKQQGEWHLVADYKLAACLWADKEKRNERLAISLERAMSEDLISTCPATICQPSKLVADIAGETRASPVLVVDSESNIIGIVSAFDLL